MNLPPETVAKLIFQISQLRWLEREYANDPNWYRRDEVMTLSRRIDEFLIINGWYDHVSKDDILKSITENENKNEITSGSKNRNNRASGRHKGGWIKKGASKQEKD